MSNQAKKTFKAVRKAVTEAKKVTQDDRLPAAALMDRNSSLASALLELVEHTCVPFILSYCGCIAAACPSSAQSHCCAVTYATLKTYEHGTLMCC